MELRLFKLLCLAATALNLFLVIPVDFLLLHHSFRIIFAELAFGAMSFFLYRESCRGRYHIATLFFVFMLIINLTWFANGGSQGSVSFYLFDAFIYVLIFFRGRLRWLLLGVAIANGVGLIASDPIFPQWVVPYSSPDDRLIDLITALTVSALSCSLMLWAVLTSYDREQRRLTSLNAEMQQNMAHLNQANDALRESEERFRLMADTAPVLIWVAGPDSLCTFFNKTWLEFTGRSMTQESGNGWLENVHPDDICSFLDTYRASFDAQLNFYAEYRLRRADGEYAWVADAGVPRYTGNVFAGFIGSCFDITERKLKEQELKESEETLKTLMDMMPVGIGWCDGAGVKEYVNRSFVSLFGYTLDDIPTLKEWFSKAYPDTAYRKTIIALCEAAIDKSVGRGTPIEPLETKITCKDGSVRHVIVSTQLAKNRTLATFTDITERDANQERMLNAQRLESLGVLAGGIAHDFNNILTGIMGNISLARMFVESPEKTEQLLEHAEQASRRAAELVSQLITFSKGGSPIKKALSVRRLVHDSVSLALHGTSVKAVLEIPDSHREIEADLSQLSQVFNNIIVNAIQAMPDGGSLTVRAGMVELGDNNRCGLPAGEYVTLAFADQGCGITARDMQRIFDPYFTTKPKGTGLGLSSAQSIVNKHGGHIEVTSVLGKGTTFTLYLPSIDAAVTGPRGVKEAAAAGAHAGGAILVMDDELLLQDVASEMLSFLGYQVTTCGSGEEAIDLYRAAKDAGSPFTAAIMDLTVPGGLGGKEAAQQILEIDPSACLIVSSGYSNDPVMAEHARYGFSAALTKPYVSEELEQILSSLTRHLKD